MADIPDREQVFDALTRLSSALRHLLSALLSVGLVLAFVLVALAIAVYFFDPLLFQAVADSPRDALADRAQVFESSTVAVGCVENATDNATVEGYQLLGARHLTVTGNVTLPDASYALTEPTVVEQSNNQFVLVVESRPTDSANRSCPGVARYTAKIQLPYGTNDYELAVRHDENLTRRVRANT